MYNKHVPLSFQFSRTIVKSSIDMVSWKGPKIVERKATKYCHEINEDINVLLPQPKYVVKARIKSSFLKTSKAQFEGNPLHGQYAREINEPHIDRKQSLAWMSRSWLKTTTEATICAVQEQAMTTKYIEKHIHKTTILDIIY